VELGRNGAGPFRRPPRPAGESRIGRSIPSAMMPSLCHHGEVTESA
jgi:hypothetical protein